MGPPVGALTRRQLVLDPTLAGPAGDRTDGVRALDRLTAAAGRPHCLVPSRWHQPGNQVGERREDEEAGGGVPVGHHEQAVGLAGVERQALGRAIQRQSGAAEDQQIKVQFARAPALAVLSPECMLETLERHEQGSSAGLGVRARRHVQGDDGIPEVRLVLDANRRRNVEPRDAPEPRTRQRGERTDARGEGRGRVAEIRPEPHVRADLTHGACQIPSPR